MSNLQKTIKNTDFWKKTETIKPKNRLRSTIFNKNDSKNTNDNQENNTTIIERNTEYNLEIPQIEENSDENNHTLFTRQRQPDSFCSSSISTKLSNFSRQSSIHISTTCTNKAKIAQQYYDCQTLLKLINELPSFILKSQLLPYLSVTDVFLLCEMDRNKHKTTTPKQIGTSYHNLVFGSQNDINRNFIQKHVDWRFQYIDSLAQVFYDFSRQKIFEIAEAKYLIVNKIVNRLFDLENVEEEPISPKNLCAIKKIVTKQILSIISAKSYPNEFVVAHIKNFNMIILDQIKNHENHHQNNMKNTAAKTLKFLKLFELEKISGLRLFCVYSCFVRAWLNFIAGEPEIKL